jgi:hypothetical protein
LLVAWAGLAGCRTPGAAPAGGALEREIRFSARVPDVADYTASELAAAALGTDREQAERALRRLEAIDTVLTAHEQLPTGLIPAGTDLMNATRGDPRLYRDATRGLLESHDLDPALRARLEQAEADDPLKLASARIRDARVLAFGRAFNAVVEPVGRSIMTTTLAPYRLASSLVNYAADFFAADVFPLQRRQALAHWKHFVERYPDAPEVAELEPRMEKAQARWNRSQRNHALRVAEQALKRDQVHLAQFYAERALRHAPGDRKASKLRDRARQRLRAQSEDQRRSVSAATAEASQVVPSPASSLTLALLEPGADVRAAARELLEAEPKGPLADEAAFALFVARGEAGEESTMWDGLSALAKRNTKKWNMARHAEALVRSPEQNAYAAFVRARWRDRGYRLRWVLLGRWSGGARRRGLPRSVEWLVDLPPVLESVATAPLRLIQLPWSRSLPSARVVSVHARRYLERHPQGEHAADLRDWLQSFEEKRENWIGALAVAEGRPAVELEQLDELREKAAQQSLQIAGRERRRDLRNSMLRRVAREFPETHAGHVAGLLARSELESATPQRIRLTRGFLRENPQLAGPRGLGLKPEFLDEDPANGELHPDGVALLGGRSVELSFIGPSGDEEDPPEQVRETLSEQRLARLVSQLEETSLRNSLLDPDDLLEADAQRDVYFERARLGLVDEVDPRAAAESQYSYRGMRERYGLVRGRESILPFDLVLQGSFTDLNLGAFPRVRPPRETPDAFLYR